MRKHLSIHNRAQQDAKDERPARCWQPAVVVCFRAFLQTGPSKLVLGLTSWISVDAVLLAWYLIISDMPDIEP